jgi:hypothetical protein
MGVKVTILVLKHHIIKTWGCGGEILLILTLSTRWRPVVSFMLQTLTPMESL